VIESKRKHSRVLVIDDELGPRESLRFLLRGRYDVHCEDSVDGGLQWLRQTPSEVIILDIKMPGKNGIEGLREIRAIDPYVSVIMLTGVVAQEVKRQVICLGANEYITKPFDVDKMRKTVEKYIGQTQDVRTKVGSVFKSDSAGLAHGRKFEKVP